MSGALTGSPRRRVWVRALVGAVVALAAVAIVGVVLDRAMYQWTYVGAGLDDAGAYAARERLGDRDWHEMLRAVGYLPTWLVVGAAFMLARGAVRDRWLGVRVIASAALAGGIADVLKPLIGRVRPRFVDGETVVHFLGGFRPHEGISFGLPSSHAAVAFGGAIAVSMAWPRTAWVLVPLAAGCGFTRMAMGAHFLTDVLGGGLVAYAIARLLRQGGWVGGAGTGGAGLGGAGSGGAGAARG